MWLHVEPAKIDSKVVLGYFLKVVDCLKGKYHAHTLQDFFTKSYPFTGCPCILRMDRGTENVRVAEVQVALRMNHTDERAGVRSIIYGSSPTNSVRPYSFVSYKPSICFLVLIQRIESWWSRLRRQKTHWWIENLKVVLIQLDVTVFIWYRSY